MSWGPLSWGESLGAALFWPAALVLVCLLLWRRRWLLWGWAALGAWSHLLPGVLRWEGREINSFGALKLLLLPLLLWQVWRGRKRLEGAAALAISFFLAWWSGWGLFSSWPLQALRNLTDLWFALGLGLLAMISLETDRAARRLRLALVLGGVAQALWGLLQWGLRWGGVADPWRGYRICGPFGWPVTFSLLLLVCFCAALALVYQSRRGGERLVWLVSLLLLVLALGLTYTRTAWLAALVAFVLIGPLVQLKRRLVLALLLVLLALGALTWHQGCDATARLFRLQTLSSTRLTLWRQVYRSWRRSPFWGHGVGAAKKRLPQENPFRFQSTHGLLWHFLYEGGLVGLLLLFLLVAGLGGSLGKTGDLRVSAGGFVSDALGATVALGLFGLLNSELLDPRVAVFYWLLAGAALARRNPHKKRNSSVSKAPEAI